MYTSHVEPGGKHFWNGFGPANSNQLISCLGDRILLSNADLQKGQDLWRAYKTGDFDELTRLAAHGSPAFPHLQEVVQAHIDRFPQDDSKGRPERVLQDITKNVSTDFPVVCKEFWNREAIYGFGDTQLKVLYDKVMADRGY